MRAWLVFSCLSLALFPGCVASVDFDPIGTDASVSGAWLVDGRAPSAGLCAERSITHVRVRFYDVEATREEDEEVFFVDHPDLVFDCAIGSFDTRPTNVLKSGDWTMRLLALNNELAVGEDNIVAMGPEVEGDTAGDGHIDLPQVDFAP